MSLVDLSAGVGTATDPRGIETQFNYNAHGLLTSFVYAVGSALHCLLRMILRTDVRPIPS
jgi:YD repeat-containing protein